MSHARHIRDQYGDVVLAVVIAALGLLQALVDNDLGRGQVAANVAVAAVLGVGLTFRRRFPLLLLIAMCGAVLAEPLLGEAGGGEVIGLFVLVAVYTAAAHTDGMRVWLAGGLTTAAALAAALTDPEPINVGAIIFFGLLFGVPWGVGRVVRRRRLREHQLEQEKAEAEAAIIDERRRIARELHDVVAHAISVIVLQARGGRKLLDQEPAETRQALDAIERTASQALDEMRRLLGLLRENDEELALAPQPTLALLDDLVSRVQAAGLPVELRVEGTPEELPPGVDLSAYRIVQEALTNALKHAGPATARVTLRYGEGELDLEISDDGAGGSGNGGGSGQGLTGIRERVAVFGGDVEAGLEPDGGYAVRARLPYASER